MVNGDLFCDLEKQSVEKAIDLLLDYLNLSNVDSDDLILRIEKNNKIEFIYELLLNIIKKSEKIYKLDLYDERNEFYVKKFKDFSSNEVFKKEFIDFENKTNEKDKIKFEQMAKYFFVQHRYLQSLLMFALSKMFSNINKDYGVNNSVVKEINKLFYCTQ